MSPAEIRALMATADQRPVTTAQVIEQARAEGLLSSWRAWLPGLLGHLAITPWEPRIGDQVTPSESYLSLYGEWRGLTLYVVGIEKIRGRDGLNITVSEQWPVDSRSDGFTDGFWIGRTQGGRDDLIPIIPIRPGLASCGEHVGGVSSPSAAGVQDPDLGTIGPGHVCKHGIRWPHACDDCDRAAWDARPQTSEVTI